MKFLYNGIKKDGKFFRVWYSKCNYDPKYGIPENTITIYARDYNSLPKELRPKNNTDLMTDYFEKDRADIYPNNPYYSEINEAYLKQEKYRNKIGEKSHRKLYDAGNGRKVTIPE